MQPTIHIPVLLKPSIELLLPGLRSVCARFPDEPVLFVDCTFGGGGHSSAVLDQAAHEPALSNVIVVGFDRDPDAISRGHARFEKKLEEGRLELEHAPFSQIESGVKGRKIGAILADLGFSSDQLEVAGRGFSFKSNDPFDLRMDPKSGIGALEYLRQAQEKEIADVLWRFGEERYSRPIARLIVKARNEEGLPESASEMAELIARATPPGYRFGRIHAATRSFQALRIYLNEELEQLDELLRRVLPLIERGGRIGMISFHSLEDRKLKQCFRTAAQGGGFKDLTRKPIEADDAELEANARARSAKLRVIERVDDRGDA